MGFQPHKFGKYFLTERIANGGMAEILKARSFGEMGFEKSLAIKKILPHLSHNQDFINMLIDEAKINVQLHHMNLVEIYDFGRVGEDYFIAMEFIDGVDLRTIVRRLEKMNRRLPVGAAVYLVAEVCKGLDYAHRKTDANGKPLGIVHRDISPPNILVSWEGEVKIVDFGIAEAASKISETSVGILKGKLPYMSPEQTHGVDIDARTDIFSAGVILYELLTCKHLFDRDASSLKTIDRIRSFKVTSPLLPAELPSQLEAILGRALQNQRNDRYPTAAEFHKELMKFLYSSPQHAEAQDLAPLLKQIFQQEIHSSQELQHREAAMERDMATKRAFISDGGQESLVARVEQKVGSETQLGAPPMPSSPPKPSHSVHQMFDWPAKSVPAPANFNFRAGDGYQGGVREMIDLSLRSAERTPDPTRSRYPIENSLVPQHEGIFDFEDSDGGFTPSDSAEPSRRRSRRRRARQGSLTQLHYVRPPSLLERHFSRRSLLLWVTLICLVLYLLLPTISAVEFTKSRPLKTKIHALVSNMVR